MIKQKNAIYFIEKMNDTNLKCTTNKIKKTGCSGATKKVDYKFNELHLKMAS